jgi:hypothetical protein
VFGAGGQSQRRRQTLLEMTWARSGWEIEFKPDGESTIFAWTKRTSSVKWAVSALPSGAHPAKPKEKTDAQSRSPLRSRCCSRDRRRLPPTRKPRAGPMISPVLRRISRRSNRRRAGDGDRIVGLDLSACAAGSDAGVVPAGNGHANGEAAPAASSSRDGGEFDLTRHDRAWLTRRAHHGRRIQRAFTA